MAECVWKKAVLEGDAPLFTSGELDPDTAKALGEEAGRYGTGLDSLSMIEMVMVFEESERARGEVSLAAGTCACDGSVCLVVKVVDNIVNNLDRY